MSPGVRGANGLIPVVKFIKALKNKYTKLIYVVNYMFNTNVQMPAEIH
jgi:hypothetical protein